MVKLPDEEVLGASIPEGVNINEAVCEDDEEPMPVTTVDKELVVADERVPEAEIESENEFGRYIDVSELVLIVIDGVEVELGVVKAVMDVVWVTLGWSTLEEFESEVQF